MPNFTLSVNHKKDIPQKSLVGEFISTDKSFRCHILLGDDEVKRNYMREMMVTSDEDSQGKIYYIILTSPMLKKIQTEKKQFLFPIFHELGHIVNRHFERNISQEQAHQERENAIKNGTVSPFELDADAFAVQYCGKSAAINALNIMYNERSKAGNPTSEHNLLALKEFELRKKAIQKLSSSRRSKL